MCVAIHLLFCYVLNAMTEHDQENIFKLNCPKTLRHQIKIANMIGNVVQKSRTELSTQFETQVIVYITEDRAQSSTSRPERETP